MLTSKLEEYMKAEQQHSRHVVKRIIAVIYPLAERGLFFRRDNERFGSPNDGNYLGLSELNRKNTSSFRNISIIQYNKI